MVIPVFHDLLQFVLESQGGLGRHTDGPGQIERGDAVLGLGDQVDGQHPDGQGPLGRGKDGALGQRGLEAAVIDLACDYAGHSRARDRISGTGSLGGQRIFNRAWWHCSSAPYVARNRGKLSPS